MTNYTSFNGTGLVASGDLASVLEAVKGLDSESQPLIFEDATGRQVDFDLRRPVAELVAEQGLGSRPRRPGRPRLGVVAREVTLLPRHWDWLAEQPRGASATLRRLVDEARRSEEPGKRAAAAVGRVMTVLAGNLPNFEEAYRALDASDRDRFQSLIADWPLDVRQYLLKQAEPVFASAA